MGPPTLRIELADGRVLAARVIAASDAHAVARHRAEVMVRLADAGLPVPQPMVLQSERVPGS